MKSITVFGGLIQYDPYHPCREEPTPEYIFIDEDINERLLSLLFNTNSY